MKKNISYYPHHSTADQHAKFKMLRVQYGWEGEGKFWALNNRIALAEDCCLDISKKYNKAAIASDLDFSLDDFDSFIKFLIEECELVKLCDNGMITNDIIQETFDKVMRERGAARERHRRTSGEKNKTSGENLYKVKESKVNENKYTECFEKFWKKYPKKKGKSLAGKAWKKKGCDSLFDKIMKSLDEHIKSPSWNRDNGQYIPMGSTWVSQERWEDELNTKNWKDEWT